MTYPDAYREGVRLFNAGHYWHAHEQWEQCWLVAHEPDATFYKGIIQAAAALVKWQQANLRGMHLNWAKSRRKLTTIPAYHMGIDLIAFVAAMDAFVQTATEARAGCVPVLILAD